MQGNVAVHQSKDDTVSREGQVHWLLPSVEEESVMDGGSGLLAGLLYLLG